eukprot:3891787-Prymnesium_polylepis.1
MSPWGGVGRYAALRCLWHEVCVDERTVGRCLSQAILWIPAAPECTLIRLTQDTARHCSIGHTSN